MTNNDFYWYWFTNIAGIGVKTQKKLLEHFGHPSTIYNAPESEIKGILTTGQCKEAVSYTHLDVYKRQFYNRSINVLQYDYFYSA